MDKNKRGGNMIPHVTHIVHMKRGSKELEVCTVCRNIVREPDVFDTCNHEIIIIRVSRVFGGYGIECMEKACDFNTIARSDAELSHALNQHAQRHCLHHDAKQAFADALKAVATK